MSSILTNTSIAKALRKLGLTLPPKDTVYVHLMTPHGHMIKKKSMMQNPKHLFIQCGGQATKLTQMNFIQAPLRLQEQWLQETLLEP